MIAALLVLLAGFAHAGVVRAPVQAGLPVFSGPAAPVPALPPYLSVASPADAALLAGVVQAAQASPTAVAVLAQVALAAEARGRPVIVEVLKMKEAGTYNLDWGVLSLRRSDMRDEPRSNVSTLIHELQHMLQTANRTLPSDLLETELEAYVVDFRVGRELGENPEPGSYDARAQDAFKLGLEPFLSYLREQYPEDAQMHKTRSRTYEKRLLRGLDASEAELRRLEREKSERAGVLKQMNDLGHSPDERRNYSRDAIAPIDAAIDNAERAIAWAKKDLSVMGSLELRAKARAYARSVIRRARAFQKIFARD